MNQTSKVLFVLHKRTVSFLVLALVAFLSLACAVSGSEAQPASDLFGIPDSLGLRTISWGDVPVISPDGEFIVYQFSYLGPDSCDGGKHREMWLVDTETKKTTLISDSISASTATWSPDGQRVAYYDGERSHYAIHVWSLALQKTKIIATDIQQAPLLSWSPDGHRIFALRESSAAAPKSDDAAKNGIVEYRSRENADETARKFSDDSESTLVAIDVVTGVENTIVRRHDLHSFSWAASPNGRFIAWAENNRRYDKPETYGLSDIVIAEISTGAVKVVARDFRDLGLDSAGDTGGLLWSPDGNTLAISSMPDMDETRATTYFVIDAQSGSMRPVMTEDHRQFNSHSSIVQWVNSKQFLVNHTGNGRELWIANIEGEAPYRIYESTSGRILGVVLGATRWDVWHPKPDTIAVFVRRDSDMKTVPTWINYKTRSSFELPAMSQFIDLRTTKPQGVDSSPKGSAAVLVLEDPAHPQDLWTMSGDGILEQLTQINPGVAGKKLGSVRLLQWKEDGKPMQAILLLPTDYVEGKRYPAIVTLWDPGIFRSGHLFGFGPIVNHINQQVYANRGFAVLIPDIATPVPLKWADGEGYLASDRPNWLEAIARQVNTVVDYGVKQGYIDPERLGIIGGTGMAGYGVMCTIVSTPRFKAAIARAPVVDRVSETWRFDNGSGRWGIAMEDSVGASLWQDRERYVANSPYYYLDKVSTPLLLTSDKGHAQSEQAYIGMKLLGKDVTLVEYAEEESYAHQRDLLERMLSFFEEHLKLE
jgi:dipeptidyl aminopeptidase/acylaminoacyl peptidase